MSSLLAESQTIAPRSRGSLVGDQAEASRLSLLERGLLAVGIFEIPVQIDKYFLFREEDAALGALGGLNVSLCTVCLILLYGVWLAKSAVLRTRQPRKLWLGMPMLAYVVMVALSLLSADVPLLGVFDLWLVMQAYLLFFYVANRISSRQDLQFALVVLSAVVIFQAAAIIGLSLLGERLHGRTLGLGPIELSVREDGRPEGTMKSPNGVSSVIYIFLMAALPLIWADQRTARRLGLLSLLAGSLALYLTQTRGAILTLVVGGGVFVVWSVARGWLPRRVLAFGALALLVAAVPVVQLMSQRFAVSGGASAQSRVHLSALAFEAIEEKPLLGHGAGNCHLATAVYANQAGTRSDWFFTTHCKYLLVWVETGFLGLVAFLAAIGSGLGWSLRTATSKDRFYSTAGLALCVAIGGYSLHMLIDIFNSRAQVQSLWLVLGVSLASYRLAVRQGTDGSPADGHPIGLWSDESRGS